MKIGCLLPLLVLMGGVGVIALGVNMVRVGSIANAEPQVISCQKLMAEGYGTNAHVLLTDFKLHGDKAVVQHKGNLWDKVWIPVGTLEGPGNNQAIKVILMSNRVYDPQGLAALAGEPQIQGMVSNLIPALGKSEKIMLLENLPGTDLDSCLLIEHKFLGSRAAHPFWGIVCIGVGVVIILGSFVLSMILSTLMEQGH